MISLSRLCLPLIGLFAVVAVASGQDASSWQKTTVEGMSFETPFAMENRPLPGETKGGDKMDAMQGSGEGVMVVASVLTYSDGTKPNLAGAAKGMIAGMAKSLGIPAPEHTATETTVDGQPALDVKATFIFSVDGKGSAGVTRSLLVTDGATIYQVMTIQLQLGDGPPALAEKILRSVSIKKAAN